MSDGQMSDGSPAIRRAQNMRVEARAVPAHVSRDTEQQLYRGHAIENDGEFEIFAAMWLQSYIKYCGPLFV